MSTIFQNCAKCGYNWCDGGSRCTAPVSYNLFLMRSTCIGEMHYLVCAGSPEDAIERLREHRTLNTHSGIRCTQCDLKILQVFIMCDAMARGVIPVRHLEG
jgi:hypothetical protein